MWFLPEIAKYRYRELMPIRISPEEPTLEITDWTFAICLAMPKADNVGWGSGAKPPDFL
jgi:hypothetical protein